MSLHLAGNTCCPLVVVSRRQGSTTRTGPAVVGLDSRARPPILRYALEHAERAVGELLVAHIWTSTPGHPGTPHLEDPGVVFRRARAQAADWLGATGVDEFAVRVEARVIPGRPAQILAEQAHAADLLVIGSHPRRTPLHLEPAPVVRDLLIEAPCPVAIVPVEP